MHEHLRYALSYKGRSKSKASIITMQFAIRFNPFEREKKKIEGITFETPLIVWVSFFYLWFSLFILGPMDWTFFLCALSMKTKNQQKKQIHKNIWHSYKIFHINMRSNNGCFNANINHATFENQITNYLCHTDLSYAILMLNFSSNDFFLFIW